METEFDDIDDIISGGTVEKIDNDFVNTFRPNSIDGKELQPFCGMRISFAQKLGMHYPAKLNPYEIDADFDENGKCISFTYPGLAHDITIVAWLCSMSQNEVIYNCFQPSARCIKAAYEWATKHGIVYPSPKWHLVCQIISGVIMAGLDAQAKVDSAGK